MKLTIGAVTAIIVSLVYFLQEASFTESSQREKELLAREFVAHANRLAAKKPSFLMAPLPR